MTASTLVRDVLHRVSVQLLDTSPQFTRWTQRELVEWRNDGHRAIAKYLPFSCTRVDAIKLGAGTRQSISKVLAANIKPGDGSAAADTFGMALQDVIRTMGADGATPGTAVRLVDREMLDLNSPSWHSTSGSPVSQYTFDPKAPTVFYVCPGVPANSSAWIEVSWAVQPIAVPVPASDTQYAWDGADTTLDPIDDRFIDDLVNYVLARAFSKDFDAGNREAAAAHEQLFLSSINSQAAAMTGINPNLRSLPMDPSAPKRIAA